MKSNSCSSRLELTGTGLEKATFNAAEEMRNIIHREGDLSSGNEGEEGELDEHEESVKELVSRLESKHVPTKPRIIESKCIEKISKDLSPKVTVNQQSFERVTRVPGDMVTVNNHVNSGSGLQPQGDSDGGAKQTTNKVVRNKNVDLALASVTRRHEHSRNPKASSGDTENLAQNANCREQPELSGIKPSSKWSNISKMESVEMVKHQDKINIKSPHGNELPLKSAQKSHTTNGDDRQVKMVNWSTVGGSLGKEYHANDRNLIQAKIYDEMEFEEFEVMGEQHYDSLNSK